MLSPRESATRERVALDGLWRFTLDPEGRGRSERWWARTLPGDAVLPVPASFNAVLPGRQVARKQRVEYVLSGWSPSEHPELADLLRQLYAKLSGQSSVSSVDPPARG